MFTCRVCRLPSPGTSYPVREMMLGLRETFIYHRCDHCGSLSIQNPPADLSRYYPANYYSFNADQKRYNMIEKYLRRKRAAYGLTLRGVLGRMIARLKGEWAYYEWFRIAGVTFDSSILDVGAGNGQLLNRLASEGFTCVEGIEPYLKESVRSPNGVCVHKRSLEESQGAYDFITLYHVFEHMADPQAALRHLHRLLKPGKMLMIGVPVMGSWAWENYGVNWVSIDAPRHFFIPTAQAMESLGRPLGLELEKVLFDSEDFQFLISDMYARDVALHDAAGARDYRASLSKGELDQLRLRAAELNAQKRGDKACFFFRRAG